MERGIAHGFRSGLEDRNAKWLSENNVAFIFEGRKITYTVPAKEHTYTPDFELKVNGIIVETKGIFTPEDRQKHLYVKAQHPKLDIRFVFQNPNAPIYKGSKTTYAKWCEKHGFKFATKLIPLEWCSEKRSSK